MKKSGSNGAGDWRKEMLSRIRILIRQADPEAVEEIKWRKPSNPGGIPVWSDNGIICTGETYKEHVRLTFPMGSFLPDPKKVFNANLEGKTRAIVLNEGEKVDEAAFKAIVREAVVLNMAKGKK